jgi:hypothetical protein
MLVMLVPTIVLCSSDICANLGIETVARNDEKAAICATLMVCWDGHGTGMT